MTPEEFTTYLLRAGRVQGPGLLFDAWWGRKITADMLAENIGPVWSSAEYPFAAMTRDCWRDMFDSAGYTVVGPDGVGVRADRPDRPVRLYRGSVPSLRRRWSWTTNRDLAGRFALGYADGGFNGRMPGRVYVTDAPPDHLLCHIHDRNESEYVVDTRGLAIREDL